MRRDIIIDVSNSGSLQWRYQRLSQSKRKSCCLHFLTFHRCCHFSSLPGLASGPGKVSKKIFGYSWSSIDTGWIPFLAPNQRGGQYNAEIVNQIPTFVSFPKLSN